MRDRSASRAVRMVTPMCFSCHCRVTANCAVPYKVYPYVKKASTCVAGTTYNAWIPACAPHPRPLARPRASFLEETRPEEDGQREQERRDDDVPGQFLNVQANLSAVHDAGCHGGHGTLEDEGAADVAGNGQDECQGQRHRRYEREFDCRR